MSTYSSESETNVLALVSLIAGVVSWVAIPLIGGIVAIVTGHMARGEIREGKGTGDGLALAGIILGYLNLVVSCVLPLVIFFFIFGFAGLIAIFGEVEPGSFMLYLPALF